MDEVPGDIAWRPEERRLVANGAWDIASAAALDRKLNTLPPDSTVNAVSFDLSNVTRLDTSGAWLLERQKRRLEAVGVRVDFLGVDERHSDLLMAMAHVPHKASRTSEERLGIIAILERVGRATVNAGRDAIDLVGFFGLLIITVVRVLTQRGRLRGRAILAQMQHTGIYALPIVGLLAFLIGVVLAYQGSAELQRFGAEIFVVNLLGISILRELGVLITAIIVAGRSGSAFAAQIGTMKVNQEIDAMQTIGLDPIEVLVVPRVLALIITLPLLVFYANVVALIGGAIASNIVLDLPYSTFLRQLQESVQLVTFWAGMIKAPVFALVIAMVGCYQGMQVSGSAQSVGQRTTQAVVQAIMLVIVLDAGFSVLFASFGF